MDQPNLDAPVNAVNQQRVNNQSFLSGQNAVSDDFLNRFRNTIGNQETTSAMATRLGSELGLPTLRSNATMLRNTINQLPSTYSAATRGFDVNANQLSRIVGQKTSELAPAVDTAERALTSAQDTLNTQMGYEQRDQDRQLIPLQTEQQMLSERLARETTLFSQENQSELDALIAKMNAGVTLSEGEKNRANALAVAEKQFEYQKQLNDQQFKNEQSSKDAQTQIVEVGGRKKLVNTQTGQVIQDLGSSSAPAGPPANPNAYLTPKTTPAPSPNFKPVYGPGY